MNTLLQSRRDCIYTLNLITVVEALLETIGDCPPCSRTQAKMNKSLSEKAEAGRRAIITETAFVEFIFSKAFPGQTFPGSDDPRIIAILAAIHKNK